MSEMIRRILNQTFDVLDEELISYVVMNKYEELPECLPSDIDISIPVCDFGKLDRVIGIIGSKTNLVITQKIWHNYRKCAYILTPLHVKEKFRLQLDFFSDFSVRSTPLLIPAEKLQSKTRKFGRFSVPDYDMEFVFLLMRRIFKNDFDKEHCMILKDVLQKDLERIRDYTKFYFGEKQTELIVKALLNEDIEDVVKQRPALWKLLKEFSGRQSRGKYGCKYWLSQISRTVFRCRYPVGMSIAFISPDGGGKSTIINELQTTCWGSFHGINVKYFRPRLFKNLGHYNVMNPNEEASENSTPHQVELDGKFKSFIRFMFYNLDFAIGGVMVKKDSIQKKLTIFDRYYYDYFVDLKRYRYCLSEKIPQMFLWMIPRPQMTFILDADPVIFYERKQELPTEELERQCIKYCQLKNKIKNTVLINVDRTIEEIVEEVTSEIILYKAKKTAKMMRIKIDERTGVCVG